MICEFCDGNTRPKTVRRQHWLNGKLYIIENFTAEVCSECGERYFHATVLDQIDRLDYPVTNLAGILYRPDQEPVSLEAMEQAIRERATDLI
jgi:YgiT-type zinc finger domain-containing protein